MQSETIETDCLNACTQKRTPQTSLCLFVQGEWHTLGAQKDAAGVLGTTHGVCSPFESLNASTYPHATLLDLHRLLVDLPFRQQIVSCITDPQLLQFWYKEFGTYTSGFRTEAISPIVNKTGQDLTIPMLHNILGQWRSALALRTVIDQGTIILTNLAKGRLGEDVARCSAHTL
jgi:hypothetical protein